MQLIKAVWSLFSTPDDGVARLEQRGGCDGVEERWNGVLVCMWIVGWGVCSSCGLFWWVRARPLYFGMQVQRCEQPTGRLAGGGVLVLEVREIGVGSARKIFVRGMLQCLCRASFRVFVGGLWQLSEGILWVL